MNIRQRTSLAGGALPYKFDIFRHYFTLPKYFSRSK